MIKVLLVDDQPSVCAGLRLRLELETDLQVVGEAGDGAMAVGTAPSVQPDVALVDVEMPDIDGITLIQLLRQVAPHCLVIILTLHDDAATRQRALDAGAAAFVAKQAGVAPLLEAIRNAIRSR